MTTPVVFPEAAKAKFVLSLTLTSQFADSNEPILEFGQTRREACEAMRDTIRLIYGEIEEALAENLNKIEFGLLDKISEYDFSTPEDAYELEIVPIVP